MKIGVISDTHDHPENLKIALTYLRHENIITLIHCGDMTRPDTASKLQGFKVIHVQGNCDAGAAELIQKELTGMNPLNFSDAFFAGEIEGVKLAVIHGDRFTKLNELLNSGDYSYIFTGHTHRRKNEPHGATRWINPGALGGRKLEERSIFILDLPSGEGKFVNITQLKVKP